MTDDYEGFFDEKEEEEKEETSPKVVEELIEPHKRPKPPLVEAQKDDFVFQHTETTYEIGQNNKSILYIWGCTAGGNSVALKIADFDPYFYIRLPPESEPIELVVEKLERYLDVNHKPRKGQQNIYKFILGVQAEQKRSMYGFHRFKPLETFYKLTLINPSFVRKARMALEDCNRAVTHVPIETFEANVPFELRFMVDRRLGGCQWIRLNKKTYQDAGLQEHQTTEEVMRKSTHAQYEWTCKAKHMEPLSMDEHSDLAPMRVLSFDIEAVKNGQGFPKAEQDPSPLVCCVTHEIGTGKRFKVAFFAPPEDNVMCDPLPDEDAELHIYKDEYSMLCGLADYITEYDPDIFTGWNTTGFDWPYLVERAQKVGAYQQFMSITRMMGQKCFLRQKTFQSKAHGSRKSYEFLCKGRFDWDGLTFMLRGQLKKFRSYRLDAIAKEVLGDQKADCPYSLIPKLYNGDAQDKARLVYYCLKDAILPLDILEKMMAFINGVEQSRVTGVPLKWLMSRGQGIKTFSNLLRYKLDYEVVPSKSEDSNAEETSGGHVEEPKPGFYECMICTLDFASLYPSEMIAYNVCYSTVVSLKWAKQNLKEGDWYVPPEFDGETLDFCLVLPHIREGIFPIMLGDLLGQRKAVKGMMKEEGKTYLPLKEVMTDPLWNGNSEQYIQALEEIISSDDCPDGKKKEYQKRIATVKKYAGQDMMQIYKDSKLKYQVLDGRQLALKVVCNSVYGFLKAFILSDKRLMSAVTSIGRWMIDTTKNVVESHFKRCSIDRHATIAKGFDPDKEPENEQNDNRVWFDAEVIYGDSKCFCCFHRLCISFLLLFVVLPTLSNRFAIS